MEEFRRKLKTKARGYRPWLLFLAFWHMLSVAKTRGGEKKDSRGNPFRIPEAVFFHCLFQISSHTKLISNHRLLPKITENNRFRRFSGDFLSFLLWRRNLDI